MKPYSLIWMFLAGLLLWQVGCGEGETLQERRLYAVKVGNFYGYIDEAGTMVIAPQFAYGVDFSEGLAAVNIGGTPEDHDMPTDGKWGFVNEKGGFEINPLYNSPPNGAMPYNLAELHRVMHDGYRFVHGLSAVWKEDRWVYIDTTGRELIRGAILMENGQGRQFPILSARTFSEGLAAVYVQNAWGYIDSTGELVIPPRFLFPVDFRDGFALVTTKDEKLLCIDRAGNEVFSQYQISSRFNEGIATYREGFKGEKVESADRYKLGLMNNQGLLLVPPQFDRIGRFGEGVAPVLVGSRKSGTPLFEEIPESMDFEGGKWGFINTQDSLVINPVYDGAKGFKGGLAAIKVNNLWGYINHQQQIVFRPQFHFAGYFDGPLAKVILTSDQNIYDGKFAYINQFGDVVWIEESSEY